MKYIPMIVLLALVGVGLASDVTVVYPHGSSISPSAPFIVYEIELGLDANGTETYTSPTMWGNLSQISYRASGLSGANTLTLTTNTSQEQLDSYNVTAGNSSRYSAVPMIADTIDFAITSGTANATIYVDLFITR